MVLSGLSVLEPESHRAAVSESLPVAMIGLGLALGIHRPDRILARFDEIEIGIHARVSLEVFAEIGCREVLGDVVHARGVPDGVHVVASVVHGRTRSRPGFLRCGDGRGGVVTRIFKGEEIAISVHAEFEDVPHAGRISGCDRQQENCPRIRIL